MSVRSFPRVLLGMAVLLSALPAWSDSQYGDDKPAVAPAPRTPAPAGATTPAPAAAPAPAPSSGAVAPAAAPRVPAAAAQPAPTPAAASAAPATPSSVVRTAPSAPQTTASLGRSTAPTVTLDRVIAVVNDEALTQYDINEQRRIVLQQMKAANVPAPPRDVLDKQVLERLVSERALLQFAKENGIRIDDTTVERTLGRIAEENKLSTDDFKKALEREGMSYATYREELRRELTVQRIRDREVDNKIMISDAEVNNYLATIAAQAGGENEYLLSHIYVSVPDQASPDQIEARRRRAEDALARIKNGDDFAQVAAGFSDAPDALQGGSLGWRSPARLPSVFTDVVRSLKPGSVSAVLRSPAGFHVVKLLDVRNMNQPTVVDQSHVRHILVKVNESTSEAEAKSRIERVRDRIVSGGAKFEDMAKLNSDDISRIRGGDLGWLSAGDT
ncbi:MAG TPA: peptidylprolyl isomerase, partial [Casimicrobiaceae bacterium]|nr:peptidylprolyl isomerase [Casimicrobiaceae bacterium]